MKNFFVLLKDAAEHWLDDHCYRWSASLAYYALFSIFPLVLLCVSIFGFVLGDDDETRSSILQTFSAIGSPETRALLEDTLTSMQAHQSARGIGAIVGVVTLLFGASGVFVELSAALNTIWRCPEPEAKSVLASVLETLKDRGRGFLLVLAMGLIVPASLIANSMIAVVEDSAGRYVDAPWFWQPLELIGSGAFLALILASLFRALPQCQVSWRDVFPGAFLTAGLFTLLKQLLVWYFETVGDYSAYGAAGAVLGFLAWIYLVDMIVLYGAEFTRLYALRHGSLKGTQESEPASRAAAAH